MGLLAEPPPIPASRMDEQRSRGLHLFLWVHTGSAAIRLRTGEVFDLAAGEGVWVPAGVDRSVQCSAGSVAVPALIQPGLVPDAPTVLARFAVPPGWTDWLIDHYRHGIAPITSSGYSPARMLDVLGGTRVEAPDVPRGPDPDAPPMPRSAPAALVARELLRSPALGHTLEEWAALAAVSPRTLRRQFVTETAMAFAQWRTRVRIGAAREHLRAGHGVAWTAAQAGFASREGLRKAFRAAYGVTPRDYGSQHGRTGAGTAGEGGVVGDARLLRPLLGTRGTPLPVPEIQPSHVVPRVNPFHVLVWASRGPLTAGIDDQTYQLAHGEAIWLPADRTVHTRSARGALGFPIGSIDRSEADLGVGLRVHFSERWTSYLLYCSVSYYTMLRSPDYDHRHILDLFADQTADQRARAVPMPRSPEARAVATRFLRQLGTTPSAARPTRLPGRIEDAFLTETRMSFPTWQHAARMRIARDLLLTGAKPGSVAGRVGYSQVSNFSRAFTRFHQISPRAYQQREADPLSGR